MPELIIGNSQNGTTTFRYTFENIHGEVRTAVIYSDASEYLITIEGCKYKVSSVLFTYLDLEKKLKSMPNAELKLELSQFKIQAEA